MKYVRDRMNYFRKDEFRFENADDFNAAVKEQNDNEPAQSSEGSHGIGFILLSLFVLIAIALIIVFVVGTIKSMDDPNQIFEDKGVLSVFFGVFFLAGLLFAGIPLVKGLILKFKCKGEAQAICIGYEDSTVVNKHGVHFVSCPIYRFNEAGTEYTVYDKKYTQYPEKLPAIGSTGTVLFDPEDPNRCIINGKVNWKVLSIVIGAILLLLALVLYFGVLINL